MNGLPRSLANDGRIQHLFLARGTGFDAPGATYPHEDEKGRCSFEALIAEHRPNDPVLVQIARIVHGADFDKLDFTSESAGLCAISYGFPLVTKDDHETWKGAPSFTTRSTHRSRRDHEAVAFRSDQAPRHLGADDRRRLRPPTPPRPERVRRPRGSAPRQYQSLSWRYPLPWWRARPTARRTAPPSSSSSPFSSACASRSLKRVPGPLITASIGVASFPLHGLSSRELIVSTDHALYAAKRDGKNRVAIAGP